MNEDSMSVVFTGEDELYRYFDGVLDGKPIQGRQDKKTGEVFFDLNDIVRFLGYAENLEEFLKTDKGLDWLNQWKKSNPGKKIIGDLIAVDCKCNLFNK
ncbi:hypothetical protein [Parabacteroides sp. Marseille-P3160]|uniref:hypothetical protein n=1 Tax=Parabacteroides sp. Marseille-P3160 TaxID=1917887 RepID=UPI0009BAF0C9|nr:hypothetical protein [Parabacteroides sp. Marseille-P3160]